MDTHVHTDECWEPDSGCDMGRNEEFVGVCPPELEKEINETIDRWLTKEPPAYIVHEDTRYNEQYDGYYNVHTREWLETKCSDPECEFCSVRPDKAPLDTEEGRST